MTFRLPDRDELQSLAAELGQALDNDAADALLSYFAPFREGFNYLEVEAASLPRVRYPERSFRFPQPDENPLGAWYVKTELQGADKGPLQGKRVAVKDSIFVADVPMMYGTAALEGFKPDFDATVVTRMLEAGADITGKAVCEYLCLHGGSVTASTGFVRNPHNPDYASGGSSSGSAALVASGAVDIALGTDQAGSVRIPSSWCGTVGMKATHGLVPYTGIPGMEAGVDHVGPITATVADNAAALQVLAGPDGLDGRQGEMPVHEYTQALGCISSGWCREIQGVGRSRRGNIGTDALARRHHMEWRGDRVGMPRVADGRRQFQRRQRLLTGAGRRDARLEIASARCARQRVNGAGIRTLYGTLWWPVLRAGEESRTAPAPGVRSGTGRTRPAVTSDDDHSSVTAARVATAND
jgi:hypothetical protein